MKKQLGLLLLVALLLFLVGWTAQTKPATYEYKVLPALNVSKDEQKINELAAQGWELVYVVPTLANGTNYGKSDLYFRRAK